MFITQGSSGITIPGSAPDHVRFRKSSMKKLNPSREKCFGELHLYDWTFKHTLHALRIGWSWLNIANRTRRPLLESYSYWLQINIETKLNTARTNKSLSITLKERVAKKNEIGWSINCCIGFIFALVWRPLLIKDQLRSLPVSLRRMPSLN